MPVYDASVATFTRDTVTAALGTTELVLLPVNLKASTTFRKGEPLGEVIATPGTFAPYSASLVANVSNVALTSNVATITTAVAHGFSVGQSVTITGLTNAVLNGTYVIASTPSGTTFTFAKTNANISSAADVGVASATDGAGNAAAVLPFACVTDASGNITVGTTADPVGSTQKAVPAIFSGFVRAEDVPGLDATLAAKLGRLIKGTVTSGILHVGV